MKLCQQYKKDWPAFAKKELEPARQQKMSEHLNVCPYCQQEFKKVQKLLVMSESFKGELKQVMETVDWDRLPAVITERVWEKQKKQTESRAFSRLFPWKWQPLTAGLVLGLILGVVLTIVITKPQKPGFLVARKDSRIALPADFVDRVDVALARRETIDYLERSQYLILELLQSRQPEEISRLLQPDKIRQLLTEKKYLNNQLDDVRLLKAKAICDQIEFLFLELSQLSPEMSAAELGRVRNMVEEKQLLLKINLVKKELQQGEV
ncbi:MAG: anti-sigma factor family protein [Candidatus Saccharicenans sp.]